MIRKTCELADTFARGMDWLSPGFLLAMLVVLFFGAGRFSLDHLLQARFAPVEAS